MPNPSFLLRFEANVAARLPRGHRHVAEVFGLVEGCPGETCGIAQRYYCKGPLLDRVPRKEGCPETQAMAYFTQVWKGHGPALVLDKYIFVL